MKKICILTCGGTITMKKDKHGLLIPLYKGGVLLERITNITKIAQVSVREIENVDSTNLEPDFWTKLVSIIRDNYTKYDGFVVTHGTDTMAYTASALSFALGNLNKPIILTGSQKPLDAIPSDAESNLINSVIVATYDIAGVFIVFGSKILVGSRSTKMSESNLDAFDSPMIPPIGEVSLEPLFKKSLTKPTKESPLVCKADFNRDVISIIITPGLRSMYLEKLLEVYRGVVLEAFGPGNIPHKLLPFFRKAKKMGKPVVVMSQCKKGATRMQLYEVGSHVLKYGAIPGNDMTIESAITKLMWLLGQNKNIDEIKKSFKKNYCDEVST